MDKMKVISYVEYPIAWILTIIFIIYIVKPPEYDTPGIIGEALFVVTIIVLAFNTGLKSARKRNYKNLKKKIIKRYESPDAVNRDELPNDAKLEKDDKGWYAYIYVKDDNK